jgi:hypothetical protein
VKRNVTARRNSVKVMTMMRKRASCSVSNEHGYMLDETYEMGEKGEAGYPKW